MQFEQIDVVVVIQGGVVQTILSNPAIRVVVVDHGDSSDLSETFVNLFRTYDIRGIDKSVKALVAEVLENLPS
jgi:hypothetical protein